MTYTQKVELEKPQLGESSLERRLEQLIANRTMSEDEFIENHSSGTLRKAKRIGLAYRSEYLEERVAYEFGYGFEISPRTHVMVGDGISEGNCHPVTEVGWHVERYIQTQLFPEDEIVAAYINVQAPGGKEREGLGMYLAQTSAPFVPKGHIVYSIIAPFDKKTGAWKNAINPF